MYKKSFIKALLFVFLMSLINSYTYAARKLPDNNDIQCTKRQITAKNIKTWEIKEYDNTCNVPEWWLELGRKWIGEISASTKKQEQNNFVVRIMLPQTKEKRHIGILAKNYNFSLLNSTLLWIKDIKKWNWKILLLKNSSKEWEIYINLSKKEIGKITIYIIEWKNKKQVNFKIDDNSKIIKIGDSEYSVNVVN